MRLNADPREDNLLSVKSFPGVIEIGGDFEPNPGEHTEDPGEDMVDVEGDALDEE